MVLRKLPGCYSTSYITEQHLAFAESVRRFTEKEISPFINEWDEAETFPRELYKRPQILVCSVLVLMKIMVVLQERMHFISCLLQLNWQSVHQVV